ncbi:hypothetical protein Leryth_014018 [Lithospermum erythrorhizon]|nr:hypothetical protein Leryth_014018 [Lithospermum erythrorhizon]
MDVIEMAHKQNESLEESKLRGTGDINMILRADQIDLKNLDAQLDKHLSRVWSRNVESQRPTEEAGN